MKKTIAVVCAALAAAAVIIAAVFLVRNGSRPAPSAQPPAAPGEHIVYIRDNAFVPEVLEINAGEKVRWVNEYQELFWIASDPHPTHTNLPDLDSLGEIATGESYSYTFKQAGSFGYHNHAVARLNRLDYARGKIIVKP